MADGRLWGGAAQGGRPCATTGSEGTPKADGPCAVLWEGGKAQGKARTACAEGGDAKGKAKGKAQGGRPCAVTLAVRRRRHDEAQVIHREREAWPGLE